MRSIARLAVASLLFISIHARAQVPGLPPIDFKRYFPHLVAISEEAKDTAFPQGVQYKFLSVRDEQEHKMILALVRRDGPEHMVREFLATGPLDNSEQTLRDSVERFSKSVNIKFEIIDLRDVKNIDELKARATSLGWGTHVASKVP